MVLTDEMREILRYLHNKKDYAIFAGFAAFLHTKVESSADIDIFVKSIKGVNNISKDFINAGWKQKSKKTDNSLFMCSTLEKNNTTFDIIFSKSAKETILPNKVKLPFNSYGLYVINKEALFISKLLWLASENRPEEKIRRDKNVVNILRKNLNIKELRKILVKMKDTFWKKGYL
jgi:hypothetical protein